MFYKWSDRYVEPKPDSEEERLGRKVEEHFRQRVYWKAVAKFRNNEEASWAITPRKKMALNRKLFENLMASSNWNHWGFWAEGQMRIKCKRE